jgi:hypothetical protein
MGLKKKEGLEHEGMMIVTEYPTYLQGSIYLSNFLKVRPPAGEHRPRQGN